ncbi:FUSC family protein [Variovorax paradoxus]|nr:FUSC family protein [Variovorax paradoxus]
MAPALRRIGGFWQQGRWRAGAQLAATVALAWLVAVAMRLPESFWAVMSVLIVMRPSAGATLDAGWERVRGTAAGALCGLAGVYLQHLGAPVLATTLATVMLLAFTGAALPGLRSAPVAALIILSASAIPGHSPLQVALLRMVQIGVGVGVALAVSVVASEYRAGPRFDAGRAALLRGMAKRLAALGSGSAAGLPAESESEAERVNAATRAALARLAVLAGSADLEARWRRRGAAVPAAQSCRSKARLAARVFQDATMLERMLRRAPAADPAWHETARAAAAALAAMADALDGKGAPDLAKLAQIARRHEEPGASSAFLLAAPVCLLLEDLQRMQRCVAAAASVASAA